MGSEIRLVVDNGDRTGYAVCICGCQFNWDINKRLNVLYKVGAKQELKNVLCCPKCLSMLKN